MAEISQPLNKDGLIEAKILQFMREFIQYIILGDFSKVAENEKVVLGCADLINTKIKHYVPVMRKRKNKNPNAPVGADDIIEAMEELLRKLEIDKSTSDQLFANLTYLETGLFEWHAIDVRVDIAKQQNFESGLEAYTLASVMSSVKYRVNEAQVIDGNALKRQVGVYSEYLQNMAFELRAKAENLATGKVNNSEQDKLIQELQLTQNHGHKEMPEAVQNHADASLLWQTADNLLKAKQQLSNLDRKGRPYPADNFQRFSTLLSVARSSNIAVNDCHQALGHNSKLKQWLCDRLTKLFEPIKETKFYQWLESSLLKTEKQHYLEKKVDEFSKPPVPYKELTNIQLSR